jgi:hypothetical protein
VFDSEGKPVLLKSQAEKEAMRVESRARGSKSVHVKEWPSQRKQRVTLRKRGS